MLVEGKEPPIYREIGNNFELTFISSPLNKNFKNLIDHMAQESNHVDVDHLLILQYLIRHEEIDTSIAADVAQRSIEQARELLSKMQNEFNLLESVGRGKGRYFTLSRSAYELLKGDMQYERRQSLDKEAVKIRILSILKTDRSLTNKEIRQLTGMNQKQVQRLVKELEPDGVKIVGKGAGTKYIYAP